MGARQLEDQWRDAFARQARSDKQAYEGLSRQAGLAPCHRLHYLQMFLEKLPKTLPWAGSQDGQPIVWAPCKWTFRVDARLRTPLGQALLKAAFALCEKAGGPQA